MVQEGRPQLWVPQVVDHETWRAFCGFKAQLPRAKMRLGCYWGLKYWALVVDAAAFRCSWVSLGWANRLEHWKPACRGWVPVATNHEAVQLLSLGV